MMGLNFTAQPPSKKAKAKSNKAPDEPEKKKPKKKNTK
jgi:hypothetical protein